MRRPLFAVRQRDREKFAARAWWSLRCARWHLAHKRTMLDARRLRRLIFRVHAPLRRIHSGRRYTPRKLHTRALRQHNPIEKE